jgi:hypothetical protein
MQSPARLCRGGSDDGDRNADGLADGLSFDGPAPAGARDALHAAYAQSGRPVSDSAQSTQERLYRFLGSVDLETAKTQEPRQELRPARNLMAAAFEPEKRDRLTGAAG